MGLNGNSEVKAHPWFQTFSWQGLTDKRLVAPYVPSSQDDNFDQKHVNNNDWKDQEVVQENSLLLRRNSVQQLFKQYGYDKTSIVHRQTTINTGKYSSLYLESQGKPEQDGNKKIASLITNLKGRGGGPGEDGEGEENVIEEDDN